MLLHTPVRTSCVLVSHKVDGRPPLTLAFPVWPRDLLLLLLVSAGWGVGQKLLQFVQVGGPLGEQEVVCVAGLVAVLHDGQDAGRALAVLTLQATAHVLWVGSKALRWRHDAMEVCGEGFGAGGSGAGARAGQRFSWRNLRGPVLVTVHPRGDLGRPAAVVGGFGRPGRDWRSGRYLRFVHVLAVVGVPVVTGHAQRRGLIEGASGP